MLRMTLLFVVLFVFTLPAVAQEQTSEAAPELTKLFSSADIGFTFHYPSDWQVMSHDSGQVLLRNMPNTRHIGADYVFVSGEAQITISAAGSRDDLAQHTGLELEADDSPVEILQAINEARHLSSDVAQAISIGNNAAASLALSRKDSEYLLMLIRTGSGDFIAFEVQTARGELAQWLPTVQAIGDSIQALVSALKLTETYTGGDGHIAFQYPHGWVISILDDSSDNVLLMAKTASGEDVIARDPEELDETFQSEEVWIEMEFIHASLPSGVGFSDTDNAVLTAMYLSGTAVMAKPLANQIGGKRSLYFLTSLANHAEELTVMVEYADDFYLTVRLVTAPGHWAHWVTTAQAVIESFKYGDNLKSTPEASEIALGYNRPAASGV